MEQPRKKPDRGITYLTQDEVKGVEVDLEVWDDMPHVWHLFAPILPEAQEAIAHIGDFLRKHVG